MKTSETAYPYFEKLANDLIVQTHHFIEFNQFKDPNIPLHIIAGGLENLKQEISKNPTVSAINIENIVNNFFILCKQGNIQVDGIWLPIHLVSDPDTTKFGLLNPINLSK